MLMWVPMLVSVPMCHWQCSWCHVMPMPVASHNQGIHVTSQFYCLDYKIQWCIGDTIGHVMLLLAPLVSHNQKSYVAHHFNHLYLRHVMVPLMMPWALCNTGAKGITWQRSNVPSQFDCLDLRNMMVSLMTPLASCNTKASASGIT